MTDTKKSVSISDGGATATATATAMTDTDEDPTTEVDADAEEVDEETKEEPDEETKEEPDEETKEEPDEETKEEADEDGDEEANEDGDEETNEEANEDGDEDGDEKANEDGDEEANEDGDEEAKEDANEEEKDQEQKPEDAESGDDFQTKALERHNYHRAKHGAPDLKWCSKCASQAQTWADKMASSGSFSHSKEKDFGENLYSASSTDGANPNAQESIDAWYEEVKDYTYGEESPGNLSAVGHFTQLIWKKTTNVGMAYKVTGDTVYVVANYLPAGNVTGEFHENVKPES